MRGSLDGASLGGGRLAINGHIAAHIVLNSAGELMRRRRPWHKRARGRGYHHNMQINTGHLIALFCGWLRHTSSKLWVEMHHAAPDRDIARRFKCEAAFDVDRSV